MRGDFESLVRQFDGLYFLLIFEHNVIDAIAAFTDEVLVLLHQWIEMLRSAAHQDLQLVIGYQFLQIAIDCAETNGWQFLPHPVVNLICGGVRLVMFNCFPNDLQLFGFPQIFPRLRQAQVDRSSTRDFCTSGEI